MSILTTVTTYVLTDPDVSHSVCRVDAKTDYIQIRVTPRQKSMLKRLAHQAGQDLSAFMLLRTLPPSRIRFRELTRDLRRDEDRRFVLAEFNDLLSGLTTAEFVDAVADADIRPLSDLMANYVAAMVEQAANLKGVAPPAWVREVEGLDRPYFVTELSSLRSWLLMSAPVAFKRRNIFVDSSIGDRV